MNIERETRHGHEGTVLALDINTDGVLSSVAEDGHCLLWSSEGKIIHNIDVHKEHGLKSTSSDQADECPLNSVVFDPSDANKLYVSSGMQVQAYDLRNCSSCLVKFKDNEEEINQLSVDDTGQYLAACDDLGEIRIIDLHKSRLFRTLRRRHSNICSSVQFRPNKSSQLLSAGLDCNIINWDFSCCKPLQIFNMNDHIAKESGDNQTLFLNPPFVHSLSVAKDGKKFATGLGNGEIGVFQFQGKSFICSERLKGHATEVCQIYYLGSEECSLVSGGNDGKINIWKENQSGESIKHELHHAIHHDSKINWITCSSLTDYSIVVADQTSDVNIYVIR